RGRENELRSVCPRELECGEASLVIHGEHSECALVAWDLEGGEMNDSLDALADVEEGSGLADVEMLEAEPRSLDRALDVLHPALAEVVHADDFVVPIQKEVAEVGADEAGSACDEHLHVVGWGWSGRRRWLAIPRRSL